MGHIWFLAGVAALYSLGGAICSAAPPGDISFQEQIVELTIDVVGSEEAAGASEKAGEGEGHWQPLLLELAVVNTSGNKLVMGRFPPDYDFDLKVYDLTGKPVPRTSFGQKVHSIRGSRRIFSLPIGSVTLMPRESMQTRVNLSRHFDLSLPGKYFVQATRFVAPEIGVIESNKLKVIVDDNGMRVEEVSSE